MLQGNTAAAADLAVELCSVTAGYDHRPVLCDVSARIPRGHIIGVAGPNGAGKTTLLRVIMGLLVPKAGEVRFQGKVLAGSRQRRWARRQMGYVPQEQAHGTLPITVFDAVLLGRWGRSFAGWRRPSQEDRQLVSKWLKRVGLAHKADSDIRELSGGQRQRAALARALIGEPSLLILDEPTTHLDSQARRELIALTKELHRSLALTTIVVTHEDDLLREHTDQILYMEAGRLREGKPPARTERSPSEDT